MPLLIRQLQDWTGNGEERHRGNETHQRATGWNQTRGRSSEDTLYMGHPLYKLSHTGCPSVDLVLIKKVGDCVASLV